MQWKRGLIRMVATFAVLWWGFWVFVAYSAWRSLEAVKVARGLGLKLEDQETRNLLSNQILAESNMQRAFEYGIMWPIVVAILGLLGWFFFRGFNPRGDAE